ncbi:MAG: L,D-transpeptidase family protein [Acidobacteria bacterium]|nr:L,D-transpeptidase family protein [Acidobacteriota bacterium]
MAVAAALAGLALLQAGCFRGPESDAVARDVETATAANPDQAPTFTAVAARVQALVEDGAWPAGVSDQERLDLERLYADGLRLLWLDGTGRPSALSASALEVFDEATLDGLVPSDYQTPLVRRLAGERRSRSALSTDEAAAFELDLSAGLLRLLRQVHLGRVDPRALGFRLEMPDEEHDFVAALRQGVATGNLRAAVDELRPPLAQYRLLRQALPRYRELATAAGPSPLALSGAGVKPGESLERGETLRLRLVALGDLAPDAAAAPPGRYAEPLVSGVIRFQGRHGLAQDGVLGQATVAALNVPLERRARQIELALERLRWLPDLSARRLLTLNIPMFELWAWDSPGEQQVPALNMRAVVGRALTTETPVFIEEMRAVIFRPFWNVPASILRNEVLPALEADPGYLERQGMEIVEGPGDTARVLALSAESLEGLQQGRLRVRQRPGPRNALGLVKFDFPNQDNVYLHGTPNTQVFARSRRDYSHGCVRVEDPARLAEWALADQPGWTAERIARTMTGTATRRVELDRPVQVVLFYTTAAVMPDSGLVRFADDIYGRDARLDAALSTGP